MAEIILVVGGCRSGKSNYALGLAESRSQSRGYVATCPVIDDELQGARRRSIRRHGRTGAGRRLKNCATWPACFAATGSVRCCW